MRELLALTFALALAGQEAGLDMDAARSRAVRYTAATQASRVEMLGQELNYAGLHPEPLPGGHFIVRFPGPHLGEDPDILAVPLDWSKEAAAGGGRAAATLVELARTLKARHFRPKHVLWLMWANEGGEGMEALIQSQEHQGKRLAHVILLEGGWEGLATRGEGTLALDLGFEDPIPDPETFRASLTLPPGVTATVARQPKGAAVQGLLAEFRTADPSAFQGLQVMTRAAAVKVAVKAMGPRVSIPPAQLAGGAAHPMAQLLSDQAKRVLGVSPEPAAPRGGALAVLLARKVPSAALGLGVFEGSRPGELMQSLAEQIQNLP
ncbi:MAG TPA: hypothetical protein VJ483_09320 [Holophagaceae bacterium]|nr:hypothetical protein [Holophagaceae bacterium]